MESMIYPISDTDIGRIPRARITNDNSINTYIQDICKEVLNLAKNKNKSTEIGILASLDKKYKSKPIFGYMDNKTGLCTIDTVHDEEYQDVIISFKYNSLIFIHNHPNNSTFSYNDVVNLTSTETLRAVIAVGNRHNLFIVTKEDEELVENFEIYVKNKANILSKSDNNRYEIKYYRDVICKQILETCPEKFGLYYEKLRRKQS